MKKIILLLAIAPMLMACGSGTDKAGNNSSVDSVNKILNQKDAEEQVIIHINDTLSYITRRLREIEDERADLTKYEADLKTALAQYESTEK